jgi:DNA-binding response OmpR family regulator
VIVVDGISETEEVLKAVLEPRGLKVDRIRGDADFNEARDAPAPRLVVCHATKAAPLGHPARAWNGVPRVVIGKSDVNVPSDASFSPTDHYLAEPFQYAELIEAINRLLAMRD